MSYHNIAASLATTIHVISVKFGDLISQTQSGTYYKVIDIKWYYTGVSDDGVFATGSSVDITLDEVSLPLRLTVADHVYYLSPQAHGILLEVRNAFLRIDALETRLARLESKIKY